MFNRPYDEGDNSTPVTFSSVGDLQTWYGTQEGVNKVTPQSATESDGKIKAITTYDYLSGEGNLDLDSMPTKIYDQRAR